MCVCHLQASKKIRAARKKAAKNSQTGLTVNLPEDKDKKEKKGFFFRRKSTRAAKVRPVAMAITERNIYNFVYVLHYFS